MRRKLIAAACFALLGGLPTSLYAQGLTNTASVTPVPVKITSGLTYQSILASAASNNRHAITIQNNNATDSCYIIIVGQASPFLVGDTTSTTHTIGGVSLTGAQASILLLAGGSYTRFFPYIPPDQILGTCTTTGDSIYVDTQ
jgi:hypothetical protein